MKGFRFSEVAARSLFLAAFAAAALYLLRPIDDPDFFWHLKTGEFIMQTGALPSEDPFAYTSTGLHSDREHFILTSYWLSQMIYYLLYRLSGLPLIAALRFVLAAALIYSLLKRMHGDSLIKSALLLIFLITLFEGYAVDRPQFFSFVFFSLVLCLMDKAAQEKDSWRSLLKISLAMFFWANLHGGHAIGQLILALFIVMEGAKFLHPALSPAGKPAYAHLAAAGIAGITCSCINPNTYHAVIEAFSIPAYMSASNTEYLSSLEMLKATNNYTMALYWFLALLSAVALVLGRRSPDITGIAVLAATGYFSFIQVRYIPFFMIAALPVISRNLSTTGVLKWSRALVLLVAVPSALFFTWDEKSNMAELKSGRWINEGAFPVSAADFITRSDIRGNMFNYYDWGGYLLWRLWPGKKVFIDGRSLFGKVYMEYATIDGGRPDGKERQAGWKSYADIYRIRYAVLPLFGNSGSLHPLVMTMIKDQEWTPVFNHLNSLIFVKESPENSGLLRRYSIRKADLFQRLVAACDQLIAFAPDDIRPYIAKGDLYATSYRFNEAKEAYKRVLEIAPYNSISKDRLEFLEDISRSY